MLETGSLYFSRADYLGDPFECSLPVGMVKRYLADIEKAKAEGTQEGVERAKILEGNIQFFFEHSRWSALSMYVNCWHMNKHESDAMWKIYPSGSEGVAILSTPTRLVKAVQGNNERISIGKVSYADYETLDLHSKDGGFNLLNFVAPKRLSFRHENELRAVIWRSNEELADNEGYIPCPPGLKVPANLHQLISAVYVSPTSQAWFRELVQAINKRYRISAEVRASKLAQMPVQRVGADGLVERPTKEANGYKLGRTVLPVDK
jgi:hypothetical protein